MLGLMIYYLDEDLVIQKNSSNSHQLQESHPYCKQYIYICPCIQITAEKVIRSYKRIRPSFQLRIIHGLTTLVKVEEDQDIITSNFH